MQMKLTIFGLILIFLLLTIASCSNSYYLSPDGDNTNSGNSPEKAWRTIDKVNDHDFLPGDQIFFEGGEEYPGTIMLSIVDGGTKDSPVVISSYGEGRAIINGMDSEGFKADSCTFLKIQDLIFSGSGRKSGNTADGLLIRD
jgi:hypothetical protein